MVSLLIAVVVMAIVFDYINGFHDAANAIATVVSTGVLPIRTAVLLAAVLNFAGAMAGTAVAKTIASGFADPSQVTQAVVLATLLGASAWNLITWWFGIPSSSSHALIGGLAGAVVGHAGISAFKWPALVQKVLVPLVASPTTGFVVAFFVMVGLVWLARGRLPLLGRLFAGVVWLGLVVLAGSQWWDGRAHALEGVLKKGEPTGLVEAEYAVLLVLLVVAAVAALVVGRQLYGAAPQVIQKLSRRLQLVSAGLMAFSHGSNDAQKSMGIITLALLSFGATHQGPLPSWMPEWAIPSGDAVPLWVVLVCAAAIAAGTAAGGTRIIKTMGTKIIRITPLQGFAAETAGALTILGASRLGIPVSTTHVINACIMGVGASKRLSAVRWGVATNILVAWVVTLPFSAALSWVSMKLLALVVE
ncbi:MAG: inorganic phosphate transporter [Myxococcaceae bacterium]|jgi:PiT family inorganic phosphate transporter|nr:inorganic phosphate transporter [Myxococcaceae bacterium]